MHSQEKKNKIDDKNDDDDDDEDLDNDHDDDDYDNNNNISTHPCSYLALQRRFVASLLCHQYIIMLCFLIVFQAIGNLVYQGYNINNKSNNKGI